MSFAKVSTRKVLHEGPEDAEIFFIGEAPGQTEDVALRPFQGASGDLLNAALFEVGIQREDCRVGNLLNFQPYKNKFKVAEGSWQLSESKAELLNYLQSHNHKVLVPLGNEALRFLTGLDRIEKRRGSVYWAHNAYVIPTIHPAAVLRDGSHTVGFLHDLAKIKRVCQDGWAQENYSFTIDPDAEELERGLVEEILGAERLWVDIETRRGDGHLKCIGFATGPSRAICIFNHSAQGTEPSFRGVVSRILSSPIPKTFHNGYFDTLLLEHHGFEIREYDFDTIIAQHILQPELPKGLDYVTSIYTDINYYKDDGKDSTDRTPREKLGRYNCLDCIATCRVELAQRQEPLDLSRLAYQMSLTPMAQHFARTGMLVDPTRRRELLDKVKAKREHSQNLFFGLLQMFGVEPFMVTQHRKVQEFLYDTLKLPVKKDQEGNVTAGEDAIVELLGTCKRELDALKKPEFREPWRLRIAALKLILQIRGTDKLISSYLDIKISFDGRVRSTYNTVGTESNRWSSSKYWDDTGLNGQTIPRESV